ncbi:biotin--[acetyl-CoA-carboxylase] ligase [Endozoicomonas sp. (ex Bugula neritina AB1)]|nr:biotin--[acetyl-CoA-carboxylase] ligase [Endozoicomonas sp. (ex Bugula neritina AB1)]
MFMEKLLTLLADGEFHSGEAMGESLGVTRAAIWKKLKGLEELGLQIDSVRGKGYRLSAGIELLDKKNIEASLSSDVKQRVGLHTCLSTTSTNDLVREQALLSHHKQYFCLAEHQTNGRGRRGRAWSTPFGSTICLSILWKMSEGMASIEGLSLAVGVAVIKALESCGCGGLKLKWPNDVLWPTSKGHEKLAGILLEVQGDPTGECEVVIGIGINVALNQQQLNDITQPATDLNRISGTSVSRNAAVAALINTISHMLESYSRGGFALFRDEWVRHDAFYGQTVILDASGNKISGIAQGVNEKGALLLNTEGGIMVFNGGEVSLRKV